MIELLAPAGNAKKLNTAIHFGANAVYFAGKEFGLRAYADNFNREELAVAVKTAHAAGVKAYVTVNIFPYNSDFVALPSYLQFLEEIGADAVIVSDLGILSLAKRVAPSLAVHISTQANTTNQYAAEVYADLGAERIVLAREMSLKDVAETTQFLQKKAQTEVFVHGAMCMSYSGRCMLSTYLTGRDSNRGECVQACRWEYQVAEVSRTEHPLRVTEDARGTYIFNSKDMCTLPILQQIAQTAVSSMKIEGRMKSEYYIATVVNAYKKALTAIGAGREIPPYLQEELLKINHREYTTGFYLGAAENCFATSKPDNPYDFAAEVLGYDRQNGLLQVEQRNHFCEGDRLEIVSPTKCGEIVCNKIFDQKGERVADARRVQQVLYIETNEELCPCDILRIKRAEKPTSAI